MSPIRIRREQDLEWLREVHAVAFPDDIWPGEDDAFWIATRGDELLGFASARPRGDRLELTRCAIVTAAQGMGLQRRLIRVREAYGRREGCGLAYTYTTRDNWPSITNLSREGYRFDPTRSPGRIEPVACSNEIGDAGPVVTRGVCPRGRAAFAPPVRLADRDKPRLQPHALRPCNDCASGQL